MPIRADLEPTVCRALVTLPQAVPSVPNPPRPPSRREWLPCHKAPVSSTSAIVRSPSLRVRAVLVLAECRAQWVQSAFFEKYLFVNQPGKYAVYQPHYGPVMLE